MEKIPSQNPNPLSYTPEEISQYRNQLRVLVEMGDDNALSQLQASDRELREIMSKRQHTQNLARVMVRKPAYETRIQVSRKSLESVPRRADKIHPIKPSKN